VETGDLVEDFELPDQDGKPRRLSEFLADGPVVLFFYPAALSAGCTAESCHFRDLGAQFARYGATRVGISRDEVDKQRRFADKHSFDYPLLSDVDGTVARAFGVRRALNLGSLSNRRMTFVIAPDRQVLAVVHSEVNMNAHADKALEALAASAK
jgi:peroxiredoxin Q/BCP